MPALWLSCYAIYMKCWRRQNFHDMRPISHSLALSLSLCFCLPTTLNSHNCGHFSKAAQVDSPVNWSLMPISLYSVHCTHMYSYTIQVVDNMSVCLSIYPTMCFYKEITFDDLLAISHVCSSSTRCCCCDFCFSYCYCYCYC